MLQVAVSTLSPNEILNEDVTLQMLANGDCTSLFNAVSIAASKTMSVGVQVLFSKSHSYYHLSMNNVN